MKFVCQKCGKCCKNLKASIGFEGLEIYNKVMSKGLIYFLIKPEDFSLGLFEWEKERLEKEAENLNIKLNIKSATVVFDVNGTAIITSWVLDSDVCPFFDNKNNCRIYDKRPLTCQTFPIISHNFLFTLLAKEKNIKLRYGTICPNVVTTNLGMETYLEEIIPKMIEIYGDTFYSAIKEEYGLFWINRTLSILFAKGKIKTTKFSFEEAMEKAKKSSIPLNQYLLKNNLITNDELSKTIKDIESLEVAIDVIRDLLKKLEK